MKKAILAAVGILSLFSCIKTDLVNDRVDPKIFISNPLSSLKDGDTHQFEVNCFNYVGKEINNPDVSWSSSDESVLTITEDGLATGVNSGLATVTVTLITSEENLTITNNTEVDVSLKETEEMTVKFEGTIVTTSSYQLEGSYVLKVQDNGVLRLSLGDDYKASTSLPGLYIYLGNNPNSIADAYEIGAVTVFQGAHFYDLPESIGLYDNSYILYWCKPFGVKVGEGQIQ